MRIRTTFISTYTGQDRTGQDKTSVRSSYSEFPYTFFPTFFISVIFTYCRYKAIGLKVAAKDYVSHVMAQENIVPDAR
jgi:hypothetical protein